ncbi:hypothetical protein HPP92_015130 [Vanilla planifolia]|uniref:Sugar phosphate transporter domain-containing protein n=1 Tax=Vanilla planifolia TaxID=51239 RepID=A0A835UTE1_VANPL|nr:hypothetical protein HPP92_015130 [Vanilla planifolia]
MVQYVSPEILDSLRKKRRRRRRRGGEEKIDEDSDDQDDDEASNAGHSLLDASFQSKQKLVNRGPPMMTRAVKLAAFFGLWYSQIVIFNIFNKKTLIVFPYPWLLASFQLLVSSLWMLALWVSGIQSHPLINRKFFFALLAPALFHTVGHVSSCVSLSKLAVSFAHVIKTSEPVFSVVLSALHGQFYPIHVWFSVVPIVVGCALATVTEINLNAQGLWAALISNVGFALRNIYSTQSLYEFNHVEGLTLYGWISIISLVFLFPVAVFVEGRHWVSGYRMALAGAASPLSFYSWVLLSGVFYHLYNQTSYRALDEISPLAFSVGNTMKRAVVIAASVVAFRNPVRPLNALGSAVALFGTFMYTQATAVGKWKKNKKKKNDVAKRSS